MSAIVFLLVFVVLTMVGAFVLWLRERGPSSMEAHIRDFERQRQALSPTAPPKRRRTTVPAQGKGHDPG